MARKPIVPRHVSSRELSWPLQIDKKMEWTPDNMLRKENVAIFFQNVKDVHNATSLQLQVSWPLPWAVANEVVWRRKLWAVDRSHMFLLLVVWPEARIEGAWLPWTECINTLISFSWDQKNPSASQVSIGRDISKRQHHFFLVPIIIRLGEVNLFCLIWVFGDNLYRLFVVSKTRLSNPFGKLLNWKKRKLWKEREPAPTHGRQFESQMEHSQAAAQKIPVTWESKWGPCCGSCLNVVCV